MLNLLSLPGKLFQTLEGYKTYIAAAALGLTALGGLFGELSHMQSTSELLKWLGNIPNDTNWINLLASFGMAGLRHGVSTTAVAPTAETKP